MRTFTFIRINITTTDKMKTNDNNHESILFDTAIEYIDAPSKNLRTRIKFTRISTISQGISSLWHAPHTNTALTGTHAGNSTGRVQVWQSVIALD